MHPINLIPFVLVENYQLHPTKVKLYPDSFPCHPQLIMELMTTNSRMIMRDSRQANVR